MATQYAVDNIKTDWNDNSLKSANTYQNGYEKAYLRIKKLGSFVSYPTGSYFDFNDKMTKLDDAVNESYDWMTE